MDLLSFLESIPLWGWLVIAAIVLFAGDLLTGLFMRVGFAVGVVIVLYLLGVELGLASEAWSWIQDRYHELT